MKKLLFGGITLALALAFALPANAQCIGGGCFMPPMPQQSGSTYIDNHAFVGNLTLTVANTGVNKVSGKYVSGGALTTGAARATSEVTTQANYTNIQCNTCFGGSRETIKNSGTVLNLTGSLANTGINKVSGKCVGGSALTTGAATAGSYVTSVVNTNILGGTAD